MLSDKLGVDMLLPYQKDWINDKNALKVCVKSRRIGITWAEALLSAYRASLTASQGGADTQYISTNKEAAKEFIRDVTKWTKLIEAMARERNSRVITDPKKDLQVQQVRYASGHRVTALASKPDSLRGRKGRVVIDEAAYVEGLEDFLESAMALLMWGNAQISVISTHNGVDNNFNHLSKRVKSGEQSGSFHQIDFDTAVEQGLYHRICKMNQQEWSRENEKQWRDHIFNEYREGAAQELLCIPSRSGGGYFNSALIEQATSSDSFVARLKPPEDFVEWNDKDQEAFVDAWFDGNLHATLKNLKKYNYRSFVGLDFGRSEDMTALAPLITKGKEKRWVPFVVEMRNLPYNVQYYLVTKIIDGLPKFKAAAFDSGGNGGYLAEAMQRQYGRHKIEAVKLSQTWYAEYVPKYRSAIEQNLLSIPDDVDLISDHLAVKLVNGVPKVPSDQRYKGTDGLYRHGDTSVALFLMWSCVKLQKKSTAPPIWAKPSSYKSL